MRKKINVTFLVLFTVFSAGSLPAVEAYSLVGVPESSKLTATSTEISWRTTETSGAYSQVVYGLSPGTTVLSYASVPCLSNSPGSVAYQTTTTPCVKLMNLSPKTKYYYKIKSYLQTSSNTLTSDGVNSNVYESPEFNFETLSLPPVLVTPVNVTATFSDAATPSVVTLRWTDLSTDESSTKITRTLHHSDVSTTFTVAAGITTYSDTSVVRGSTYLYKLQSCDTTSNCSESSPVTTINVPLSQPVPPTPPSGFRVATSTSYAGVKAMWSTAIDATSYRVMKGNTVLTTDPFTSTSLDINPTHLTPGLTHTFSLVACKAITGGSPLCSNATSSSITIPQIVPEVVQTPTLTAPLKPTNVGVATSTTVDGLRAVLSWSAVNDALFYKVSKGNDVASTTVTTTSSIVGTNLSAGTYLFSVSACKRGIDGKDLCSPVAQTPLTVPEVKLSLVFVDTPNTPLNLRIATSTTPTGIKAILSWSAVTDATSYKITKGSVTLTPSLFSGTSFDINPTHLTPGLTHTFSLVACKAITGGSPLCSNATSSSITIPQIVPEVVQTPTLTAPLKPTNVRVATSTNSNGSTITTVSWSAVTGTNMVYKITKGDNTTPIIITATSLVVGTNLVAGSYRFAVSACKRGTDTTEICSDYVSNSIVIPQAIVKTTEVLPTAETIVKTVVKNTVVPPVSYEISNSLGQVIPGSYVVAINNQSGVKYSAKAAQDGRFSLILPNGVYTIEFSKSNLQTETVTKIITVVSGKVTATVDRNISAVKRLSGKLILVSGSVLVDGEISAYNNENGKRFSTVSDAKGLFSLDLAPGSWNVAARPKENATDKNWEPSNPNLIQFNSLDTNESKDITITVVPITGTVTVTIKDEAGNLIPNAGVTIDSDSILADNSKTNSNGRRAKTIKTNSTGIATSKLSPGVYFMRAVVPDSLGFIQASEQEVVLTSGQSKQITFTLAKEKAIENITVSGVVSFDDNSKTSAFITAWSDKGEHVNTETTNTGSFTLTLVKGQTWHVKATKDDTNGKSYISDKQTILVENEQTIKPLEFVFHKEDVVTLPPPVVIKSTVAETSIVASDDGARFNLPANGVAGAGSINVEIKPTVEAPSQSANTVVSTAYDITVKNSAGQEISQLEKEAEILIPYSESELAAAGVKLEDVVPSYFDETLNTWVSVQNFTINKDKKVFVLRVNHLTRFALIAAADTLPPSSPTNIVTDAITPTDVRITWNNPSTDFSHAKIYRSENPGTFGQIIATEVLSNSFIDKTAAATKKIYYYTIRAVDAAGNESINSNQLALTVTGDALAAVQKKSSLLLPPGQDTGNQIVRKLSIGSKGEDVTMLQKALKYDGFYATGPITGYYGKKTENAVFRFQNYYKNELLIPNGYKIGTGVVGEITRKKINQIILESEQ